MGCIKNYYLAVVILYGLFITGCANKANDISNIPVIESKNQVYANLEKDIAGGYYFSRYSFIWTKNSINLNNLTHNYNKEDIACRIGLGIHLKKQEHNKEICDGKRDVEFRVGTVDGSAMFANVVGNVIAVAATLGVGTSAYYTSKFDVDAFEDALNDALSKQSRESLIKDFNSIYEKYNGIIKEKNIDFEVKREKLNLMLNKALIVNDKTELLKEKATVSVQVQIGIPNDLVAPQTWINIEDFETQIKKSLPEIYSKTLLYAYCQPVTGFKHTILGCQQSWGAADSSNVKPVIYIVEKANNYKYTPVVKASNNHIKVNSESNGNVTFLNLTDSFLTIDSFSLYIGGKIETISNLEILLPPKAINNNFNLSKFDIFKSAALKEVVKNDLSKLVEVGLAMKYKVVDTNLEKTLYKTDKIKYHDFLGQVVL